MFRVLQLWASSLRARLNLAMLAGEAPASAFSDGATPTHRTGSLVEIWSMFVLAWAAASVGVEMLSASSVPRTMAQQPLSSLGRLRGCW